MTYIRNKFLGVFASWRLNHLFFRNIILIPAILFLPAIAIAAVENSPATTQSASQQELRQWVEQLGSDDPQTRRTALGQLMALDKSDLPSLRAVVISEHSLLPQQIAAIHQAVTQVFLAAQQFRFATDPQLDYGFLGIQMMSDAPSQPPDGVLVWSRIPGFVAYRMLQQGDIIVKIIRQPALPDLEMHRFDQFARIVGMMHAGDMLRLQVLRFGRPIDVSIPLDHRPLELTPEQDLAGVKRQQWVNARAQAAEEYWNHEFSSIDPAPPTSPAPTSQAATSIQP
jgi:hypothetical protein